jgi:hypothetical protein
MNVSVDAEHASGKSEEDPLSVMWRAYLKGKSAAASMCSVFGPSNPMLLVNTHRRTPPQNDCIAALSHLVAKAQYEAKHQLDLRCVPEPSALPYSAADKSK